jgi:hypothetical protein
VKINPGLIRRIAPKKQIRIQITFFRVTLSLRKIILNKRTSNPFIFKITAVMDIGTRLRDSKKHIAPTHPIHIRTNMIFISRLLFGKKECFVL